MFAVLICAAHMHLCLNIFYSDRLRCGEKDGYGLYIYRNGDIYDGVLCL